MLLKNLNVFFIALAIMLCASGLAHAQFGTPAVITVPGSVTSDQAAEASLADIDTVQLPGILTQDTATATSVTTGVVQGLYTPANLNPDDQLFLGVNNQNFTSLFPGWQALPANSTDAAETLVSTVLLTYQAAIADTQSMFQLSGDSSDLIEQESTQTTNLLTAVQANTEAVLQLHNDMQALKREIGALVMVEATKAAEELNANAQERASESQGWWNTGE